MALLNYTTSIAASKTVAEIQALLVRKGARSVVIEYDDRQQPAALSFAIRTPYGERGYRLPANPDGVWKVLTRQFGQGRKFSTREHALNVAWRITKTWLEGQLAVIEAGLMPLDQVLLPFLELTSGQTMYEAYVSQQKALPEGRAAEGR